MEFSGALSREGANAGIQNGYLNVKIFSTGERGMLPCLYAEFREVYTSSLGERVQGPSVAHVVPVAG